MIKQCLRSAVFAIVASVLLVSNVKNVNASQRHEELVGGGAMPCMQEWDAPIYSVNGKILDQYIQQYLYDKLRDKGCEWWYEYALCQAYQESRFDKGCVNPRNLEDKGLFQYKERYWAATAAQYGRPDADIFDVHAQIDVYTSQMAERCVTRYCDPWYMLSDHYTGGCGYSQEYVNDVIQWLPTMEEK